jgi:hypothetical protein
MIGTQNFRPAASLIASIGISPMLGPSMYLQMGEKNLNRPPLAPLSDQLEMHLGKWESCHW